MIRNATKSLAAPLWTAATSSAAAHRVAAARVAVAPSVTRTFGASASQCKKQPETLKPGQVDEHARIFDPDAREGAAAATDAGTGSDFAKHRPVDTSVPSEASQAPPGTKSPSSSSASSSSSTGPPPAPEINAGSGVDPGYSGPTPGKATDPFPMPFDSSLNVNLSSPSQSDSLEDLGAPLRVPGREPGMEGREQKIRRLIYQTRKRGILETDLLMSTFASKELWSMSDAEVDEFDRLLDEPDWDIYYWLVGRKPVPSRWKESFEGEGRLGARLRKHTKNEEKEVRWMPDTPPTQ